MKIRGLCLSAAAAVSIAAALSGCGKTYYYAGRTLPPSGIANRVLITVQNPSSTTTGALTFVDAYYDIRSSYDGKTASYSISGYSGSEPTTIQNMPNEQIGAVYGSGDGSLTIIDYAKEKISSAISGLSGYSSSVFITSNQKYVFAANQQSSVFTVIDNGTAVHLSLPGVYRVSVNVGGTAALAFVKNSDYAYYPIKLTSAEQTAYSSGSSSWPTGAVDCKPANSPTWCLMQALDSGGNALTFDRPVKAIFSSDGGTAYVLNCGPECGGTQAAISTLPVAPMIFTPGARSGALSVSTLAITGGASNALLSGSTLYTVGQMCTSTTASVCSSNATYWRGMLSVVNLSTNTVTSTIPISDGTPGGASRMILGDDDTLWIGMTGCTNGYRADNGLNTGCLTMFNTSSNTVTLIESTSGDATGIAAIPASASKTGVGKVYAAIGGQVHIYQTTNGLELDNQYVTVSATVYDVAYMDAYSDSNNTVY